MSNVLGTSDVADISQWNLSDPLVDDPVLLLNVVRRYGVYGQRKALVQHDDANNPDEPDADNESREA